MNIATSSSALLLGLTLGSAGAAQTVPAPGSPPAPPAAAAAAAPDDSAWEEGEEIVVTGALPRGSVSGDIRPEQQLSAADVRSYGVSSVSDLLNELAPQTNAGGGAPVVLLNGKRISSFQEIEDIPSEAIARVEILPEEVSLKFGYPANQKVVNIVLRQRFRALTAEARAGTSTQGGRNSGNASANLLRIRGDNRFNLDVEYQAADQLLESQRNILTAAPRAPYSLAGTVAGLGGGEIDPALSALGGAAVTIAGVPAGAATAAPALADFVAGAGTNAASDLGRFRTLSPSTESLKINAVLARTLPGDISGTLNGSIELIDSDSLQGLAGANLLLPDSNPFSPFGQPVQLYRYLEEAGALGQSVRGTNAHLGLTLNGEIRPWRWSFTGNYDRSETRTATERGYDLGGVQSALVAGDASVNPFAGFAPGLLGSALTDRARARSSALGGDLLLSGPLFTLPAGRVTATVRVGASQNDFSSRSLRAGIARSAEFDRTIASGQASIDIPVASRRNDVLAAIGDLSLNANAGAQHLSDFGTLSSLGYGVRWTPIPAIRLIASANQDRTAPSGQQLNNPLVVTPNLPLFDYTTGQTVFVTQISGANPALRASERNVSRIALTLKPFDKPDLTVTANYSRARTDNPIAGFPSATPQIEAAFADRFIRDEDGALLQVDARPINFARSRSSQLLWGVNLSVPLKSRIQKEIEAWRAAGAKPEDRPADLRALFGRGDRRQRDGAAPQTGGARDGTEGTPPGTSDPASSAAREGTRADGERGGGRGFGGGYSGGAGGGGRGGRGGGGGGGRLQFALYHTWHLTESVLIAPGLPALDLLDGDAIGNSGGQPRHELQGQAGYTNNGLGARLSANWQSGTRVDNVLGGGSGTLRFSDLATANLRLFANFGQMPQVLRDHPFLRGARLTLSVNNLFNARQSVSDGNGSTPLRYQPGYLDPVGRTVTIGFRKLFP
ncbi:MAG: hypothetical protein JWL91_2003 [Sphingomonas bacterium]|nr:TonB-dependent receptor [Sphingomonas bacterium]MDB5690127.1 hypothetical protein [Sphingomonas bacterium]